VADEPGAVAPSALGCRQLAALVQPLGQAADAVVAPGRLNEAGIRVTPFIWCAGHFAPGSSVAGHGRTTSPAMPRLRAAAMAALRLAWSLTIRVRPSGM
jgi:hypothetical protein